MITRQQLNVLSHFAGPAMLGAESRWEIRSVVLLDWPNNLLMFESTALPVGRAVAATTIGEFSRWAAREILPTEVPKEGMRVLASRLR